MTQTPNPGGLAMSYDAEGRMTSAAGVTYTYDGDGKRVKKSSGILYWYGMGSDPLFETDAWGNNAVEYVFFGGKRIARRDGSGNLVYYFSDHLGTSRVVTDATGNVLDDVDFYPFGGERVVASSSGNRYKFTGKERDSESGLDHFGARYLNSSTGRFVSPDTPDYSNPLNPQTWNLYPYTINNPLRYIDPTGHTITCPEDVERILCLDEIRQAIAAGKARQYIELNKQGQVVITDEEKLRELGGENAQRLLELVRDPANIPVVYEKVVSAGRAGSLWDRLVGAMKGRTPTGQGFSATPSQGYQYQVSLPPPGAPVSDVDAARSGVRAAKPGERMAHELLGHIWGELKNGNPARVPAFGPINRANHIDALNAENNARGPEGGRKIWHGQTKLD